LSQIISALSILILTPVLLNRLGANDFGLYGVILNVVVFAGVFDLGLNIGLLKKLIHQSSESEQLINTLFYFFVIVLLLGIPICYLIYYFRIVKVENAFLFYAVITSFLIAQNLLAALLDVIIQSSNKIFVGKIIRVVKLVLEFIFILILSAYYSVKVLLIVSLLVNMIYLLLLYYYAQKEFPFDLKLHKGSLALFKSHIVYSFWYFLTSVAGMLVFNSQVIWINLFIGAEGVSKYLIVTRFFEIIRIGISNFTIVLFPRLAKIQAEGNWVLISDLFFKSLKRVTLFSFFVFLLTYFFGMPFFLIWSKYSDTEMKTLFTLFAVFIFFIAIDNVSAIYISALKLNKLPTIVSLVQGVVGLFVGSLLLHSFGIVGMAAGSLIALLSTNLIFNPWYLNKKFKEHIQLQN
jgi:O-antigen/teichoic acid export membrane protein